MSAGNLLRLVLKNSAIYGVLPQIPKVASFFVLPFITPYLSATDYGVVGIVEVYIGLFSALQFLGTNVVLTNVFYKHKSRYLLVWRQFFGFFCWWLPIYGACVAAVLWMALPPEVNHNRLSIVLMKVLPIIFFSPADFFMTLYFRLTQRAWPLGLRSLILGFVAVGVNYYLIAVLRVGYMGWIVSSFVVSFLSAIVFFIPLFRELQLFPILRFHRRMVFARLRVSLPVIPHSYSSYLLNTSDRLVMERVGVTTANIGLYSLANSFGAYVNTVIGALNQALGPNLLQLIHERKWKDYRRVVFLFQLLVLFMCFGLALWVDVWLPLLVRNGELLGSNFLVVVIIMSYSYFPIYVGCNQPLFYFEKTQVIWRVTAVAGVMNLLLNITLMPVYGYQVAAWTTFAAMLIKGFSGFRLKVSRELNGARLHSTFWFICMVVGLVLCYGFYTFPWYFLVMVMLLYYFTVLGGIHLIDSGLLGPLFRRLQFYGK